MKQYLLEFQNICCHAQHVRSCCSYWTRLAARTDVIPQNTLANIHLLLQCQLLSQECLLTLSGLYMLGLKLCLTTIVMGRMVWCNRCWTLSAGARRAIMDALLDLSDIVVMTEV